MRIAYATYAMIRNENKLTNWYFLDKNGVVNAIENNRTERKYNKVVCFSYR